MRRRNLLLSAPLFLAACNNPPASVSAWASKASALAAGLGAIAPQLAALTGLPSGVAATATDALKQAATLASQVASITDPAKAQPVILQVTQALSAALAALGPFMPLLPPPVAIALEAAQVLLPVIVALINPGAARPPRASVMTPDQAELILLGAAARR